jgi:hypothetical protein
MFPELEKVRERARQKKEGAFTALLHHVIVDLPRAGFAGSSGMSLQEWMA